MIADLGISCRISKNPAGLGLTLETSDTLGITAPWSVEPSEVLFSETDNGDGTVSRTYRLNAPIGPGTREFLRAGYHYTE